MHTQTWLLNIYNQNLGTMKTPQKKSQQHAPLSLFLILILFLFLSLSTARAQSGPTPESNPNMYATFSPSMAVIIAVLVAALFFMGFFSIYIRHCYDAAGAAGGTVGRGVSMRARRAAAARGLDASVIDTFPTFSYSEVKDHKIGKGALECAVCLNEFEDDETLRLLPKCDHVFHPDCIDAWLGSHVTCPVCRANLDPQFAGEPVEPPPPADDGDRDDAVERSESRRSEEIAIQVDVDQPQPERNVSFELPSRPARSWSIRRPKMLGFGKFRSHSTGHSLVQPGENVDRFTLRLPEGVRKEVMDRAMLNRTRSLAAGLQREGSSRKGYRTGAEEASSRAGRFYRRIEVPGRGANSDRWVFFTRGLSFRSPRVVAESGEGSSSKRGGGKSPVKMPSFKCLEPKADGGDENRPFSGESPV